MKWLGLCFIAGLALWAAATAVDFYTTPGHPVTPSLQPDLGPVPDVTFHAADGTSFGWEAAKGRYVLVNFWATWCTPCKAEMPLLGELAERYPDRLTILAVSADAPNTDFAAFLHTLDPETQRRLARANVQWVRDSDRRVADAFQVYRYPESYLVGPERRIRTKIAGVIKPGDFRMD